MDTANASGGDIAVRMAIGETHVLRENKEYFAANGVDISFMQSDVSGKDDVATKKKKQLDKATLSNRSGTVLLAKNLPNETDRGELMSQFGRYGTVLTFLLPPSRTVAIIEFAEPTEARKAFSAMAYRKYKHVPLYLEWAPRGVLDGHKVATPLPGADAGSDATANDKDTSADADDGSGVPTQTVFVKNIHFDTTEAALTAHVEQSGFRLGEELRAVSLPPNARVAGQNAGYGFVEFRDKNTASRAVTTLMGSKLEGHALETKMSGKKLTQVRGRDASTSRTTSSADKTSCKLIVRNVAFQATEKEIKALFANFGAVKRVRVPKKMGGSHRGFAFVDFTTHSEAAAAVEALAATHLYGRHLVIEWAKDDETTGVDISTLRDKAGGDARALSSSASRKRKERTDGFEGN
jgi:multiple RNA-binding domain-containing protein 1